MSEAPELLLDHHLKKLKLPAFLAEYAKLARQCAAENVDHIRYLKRLTELELIDRERRPTPCDLSHGDPEDDRAPDQGGEVPGDEEPR